MGGVIFISIVAVICAIAIGLEVRKGKVKREERQRRQARRKAALLKIKAGRRGYVTRDDQGGVPDYPDFGD